MLTVKYKGEVIDIKDIEITWRDYGIRSHDDIYLRTGDIEDYAQSKYSEGYDAGYDAGYDEGTYQDA